MSVRQSGRRSCADRRLAARSAIGLLLACVLAGCGVPSSASGPPAPVFRTSAEGDGSVVGISNDGDTAIIDVQSSSGIGAATIDLVAGAAPTDIVVRLHLRGLEALRLSYDQTTIAASVPSSDSRSVAQHIELPDGATRPLTPASPLWLQIRIVAPQAAPAIPLQQGYFEVRLPPGLLHAQQRSFTLRWIDFYRG